MKTFNKKKLPSRHTSLGPDKAPQRSFYYAMNLTKKDVFTAFFPFVGIARRFYGMYGSNGFNEYQILIKKSNSVEFVEKVNELIKSENPSLTVMIMKLFRGKQRQNEIYTCSFKIL